MYFLIAGYNTMSAEEKAKYNIEKIVTLFRNVMFAMAAILIVGFIISLWLRSTKIEIISLLLALGVGVPYLLIKSNSRSYRTKK